MLCRSDFFVLFIEEPIYHCTLALINNNMLRISQKRCSAEYGDSMKLIVSAFPKALFLYSQRLAGVVLRTLKTAKCASFHRFY